MTSTADLKTRLTELMPAIRADLEDLVRIQSVSADPERAGEVQRSAEKTQDLFVSEGFDAQILSADGGAPAVVAKKPAQIGDPATAKTVL
ncbi:MAG: hypothetical protein L0H93_20145, partial [Nocardioides sp.]|nr:hypothetical protein [Nocardioides sp.]